ncbi:transposase [Pediococcus cellicola]|uniref:Transposase n=1 Tax=Pediococcus cellicola TaxID=319652 RepID=A0A0R2IPF4_9LACO|nr:transposase [Pediococcus cellicola]
MRHRLSIILSALKLPRSTYYHWKRYQPSQHERVDNQLKEKIKLIWENNYRAYGYPRITMVLRKSGICVGSKRILRLMREMEIHSLMNRRFKKPGTHVDHSQLNNLFKKAKKGKTITLIGNFKMNGNVKLPTKANVHVNATKANFTGKSGFFYGVLTKGLNWQGGTFYGGGHEFRLLRNSRATFKNASFHQACGIGGHIFDLMGCSNITITHSHFYGYGHTLSTAIMRKNGNHGEYGESIQTDYANCNSGGPGFNKYGKGHFNGTPSTYITVTHNTWAPEYSGRKLVSLAQVAIGQHDTISSNRRMIAHINFSYNTVKNAVRLSGMGVDIKYFGAPVHFESSRALTINHNTFSTTLKRARPENDIIISNQYGHMPHTTAVSIQNNSFTGYHATHSAIQLYARRGHSIKGVKVRKNATHGMCLIKRYGNTTVSY